MDKLWVRIIKKHRIAQQSVLALDGENVKDRLVEICHALDISVPLWLPKHEREFAEFHRTSFNQDHFMEHVSFDRMEVELFDETTGAHKSNDPRNAFDDI